MNPGSNAAVQAAIASTAELIPFSSDRRGHWVYPAGTGITDELEVLPENQHGEGMFRIGWGIRAAGVADVLGLSDLPGTEHATICGDLGSLAERKRGMTMLSLGSGGAGGLTRLWWGTRGESPEQLGRRIAEWVSRLAPVLRDIDTYDKLADFVRTFPSGYGKVEVHPDNEVGRLQTETALRAVGGDPRGAEDALSRWRAVIERDRRDDFLRKLDDEFVRRVEAALGAR